MRKNIVPMLIALSFTALVLFGCDAVDSMQHGFEHSQAVSEKIEKTLGVKSFVGFHWNNGSLTSVNVTFNKVPAEHSLSEIIDLSKEAVIGEFKQEPKEIIIAFTVKP